MQKITQNKWTAITPSNKEKHLIVVKVVMPELTINPIEIIEVEAIHSKRIQLLARQQLNDKSIWPRGWV